jgi:hypothetical protein
VAVARTYWDTVVGQRGVELDGTHLLGLIPTALTKRKSTTNPQCISQPAEFLAPHSTLHASGSSAFSCLPSPEPSPMANSSRPSLPWSTFFVAAGSVNRVLGFFCRRGDRRVVCRARVRRLPVRPPRLLPPILRLATRSLLILRPLACPSLLRPASTAIFSTRK